MVVKSTVDAWTTIAGITEGGVFFADESALPVGVRVMTNLALDYLFGGK